MKYLAWHFSIDMMEKDKYHIRQAKISDAVKIRECLKTWLHEAPFNFGNTNNKKSLENIVFYIKNSFVIVVEYENIIVGTLAATGLSAYQQSRQAKREERERRRQEARRRVERGQDQVMTAMSDASDMRQRRSASACSWYHG